LLVAEVKLARTNSESSVLGEAASSAVPAPKLHTAAIAHRLAAELGTEGERGLISRIELVKYLGTQLV
jgi:hypothetical protein